MLTGKGRASARRPAPAGFAASSGETRRRSVRRRRPDRWWARDRTAGSFGKTRPAVRASPEILCGREVRGDRDRGGTLPVLLFVHFLSQETGRDRRWVGLSNPSNSSAFLREFAKDRRSNRQDCVIAENAPTLPSLSIKAAVSRV